MSTHDSPSQQRRIVIIGAGYSGTLTAVNILRQNPGDDIRIILVEQRAPFGRGLAYRTWDDNFLLNVPAGNMSALADEPDDFVRFIANIDPAFGAASFIPRRIYGDYIEHTLAKAEKEHPHMLQRVCGEVVAVRPRTNGAGHVVALADGQNLVADQTVLALGHFPPAAGSRSDSGLWVDSPWDFETLDRLDPQRPVLLLGSAHTAIDVLFRLTRSSDSRKIFLLSRRGLLPREHRFAPRPPTVKAFPEYLHALPATVRAHMRALRAEIGRRKTGGADWRDVINELRPHIPQIWDCLPPHERRRFFIHAMAYWDIHRHRLAPAAYCRLNQMLDSGQVEVVAGRILATRPCEHGTEVTIRERSNRTARQLIVGSMVNCTGPTYDIAALSSPLLTQLLEAGLLKQDPLKIGLEVDDRYRVIDHQGQAAKSLFYVGPMLKARYWEAIAVPELRQHCQRIAQQILAQANTISGT